MSSSASQSGQNFACEVRLEPNIQPMWAKPRPLVSAFQSLPNRQGECGSPSLSLYLWWRRWSATQVSNGPSMASDPAIARAILKPRVGLERPVGEVAVEAHADPEPGNRVEHHGDHDVVPAQAPAPGQRDGGQQGEHGHGHERGDQDALERAARLGLQVGARSVTRRLVRGVRGVRDRLAGGGRGRGGYCRGGRGWIEGDRRGEIGGDDVGVSGHGCPRLTRRLRPDRAFRADRVWGLRGYAYVTVGYGTVGCASTWGNFF